MSDEPAARRFTVRYYPKAGVVQCGWGVYKVEQKKFGCRVLTDEEREENQRRATYRAAANIRRDLLAIGADRMLTLTYRENQIDRKKALKDLSRFVRVMRKRFAHWASVTVLEYQQRGACHFHLALAGFYDVVLLRSEWVEIVGRVAVTREDGSRQMMPNGNIDMAFEPDGRGNACSKLAAYMAKYLRKGLDEGREVGDHRYFRTQGIERPREVYYIAPDAPEDEEMGLSYEVITTLLASVGGYPAIWFGPTGPGRSGCAHGERNN
ncbi:MAG: hypothetical protein CAF43_012210 [Nitrospira sp. CG24C]|nr:MAG: hypothetical protein CAF43_012210 [Nitrospira sp. CG24C]